MSLHTPEGREMMIDYLVARAYPKKFRDRYASGPRMFRDELSVQTSEYIEALYESAHSYRRKPKSKKR